MSEFQEANARAADQQAHEQVDYDTVAYEDEQYGMEDHEEEEFPNEQPSLLFSAPPPAIESRGRSSSVIEEDDDPRLTALLTGADPPDEFRPKNPGNVTWAQHPGEWTGAGDFTVWCHRFLREASTILLGSFQRRVQIRRLFSGSALAWLTTVLEAFEAHTGRQPGWKYTLREARVHWRNPSAFLQAASALETFARQPGEAFREMADRYLQAIEKAGVDRTEREIAVALIARADPTLAEHIRTQDESRIRTLESLIAVATQWETRRPLPTGTPSRPTVQAILSTPSRDPHGTEEEETDLSDENPEDVLFIRGEKRTQGWIAMAEDQGWRVHKSPFCAHCMKPGHWTRQCPVKDPQGQTRTEHLNNLGDALSAAVSDTSPEIVLKNAKMAGMMTNQAQAKGDHGGRAPSNHEASTSQGQAHKGQALVGLDNMEGGKMQPPSQTMLTSQPQSRGDIIQ
jgi:hypothetical protein